MHKLLFFLIMSGIFINSKTILTSQPPVRFNPPPLRAGRLADNTRKLKDAQKVMLSSQHYKDPSKEIQRVINWLTLDPWYNNIDTLRQTLYQRFLETTNPNPKIKDIIDTKIQRMKNYLDDARLNQFLEGALKEAKSSHRRNNTMQQNDLLKILHRNVENPFYDTRVYWLSLLHATQAVIPTHTLSLKDQAFQREITAEITREKHNNPAMTDDDLWDLLYLTHRHNRDLPLENVVTIITHTVYFPDNTPPIIELLETYDSINDDSINDDSIKKQLLPEPNIHHNPFRPKPKSPAVLIEKKSKIPTSSRAINPLAGPRRSPSDDDEQ